LSRSTQESGLFQKGEKKAKSRKHKIKIIYLNDKKPVRRLEHKIKNNRSSKTVKVQKRLKEAGLNYA